MRKYSNLQLTKQKIEWKTNRQEKREDRRFYSGKYTLSLYTAVVQDYILLNQLTVNKEKQINRLT